MHDDHHVFLSYSRADNEGGQGWVTALRDELVRRHRAFTGRELRVFFDTGSIEAGRDWRADLGRGLRTSRLFLAFLSPNYARSENCLWEWAQYVRREHGRARGDDGIVPVYFVTPSDLLGLQDPRLAEWLADLKSRNVTSAVELHRWFSEGPRALAELDAAERSTDLRANPRGVAPDAHGLPADGATLAARLDELDRHIARRLDRLALADLAPTNVVRSNEYFVGRRSELVRLHEVLTQTAVDGSSVARGRAVVAAAHSPGGLGKTALAREYAHAYAEFYAAGGAWEVRCEGSRTLGEALLRLADEPRFAGAGRDVGVELQLTEAQKENLDLAASAVLDFARRVTEARLAVLRERLGQHPEHHSPVDALVPIGKGRCLLVLDNVSEPEFLSAEQVGLLPDEGWLEVLVTTRLDPERFGMGDRWQAPLEVVPLPEGDALDLLREFQPGHRFACEAEERAARDIVRALGGYTLAVELVAAYLGVHAGEGVTPSGYLGRLRDEGLTEIDALAGESEVAVRVRHEQKTVGVLVGWTLDRLSAPALSVLQFASCLQPDRIPLEWLEALTRERHPEAFVERSGYPLPWPAVWKELHGLRLLHAVEGVDDGKGSGAGLPVLVRLHRVVAEHVAKTDPIPAATTEQFDGFFRALGTAFEHGVGQGDDAFLVRQSVWLRDQLEFLVEVRPTANMAMGAAVIARHEGLHGALGRAIALMERSVRTFATASASLEPAEAGRISSSLSTAFADLLARRGQAGDAEQALAHYARSLEADERLLTANPKSAQAARDVSVSLAKLADFMMSRGQAGDAKQALAHYARSLEVAEGLLAADPESTLAARDVSVSLTHLADFLASRGQSGDAEQALAHYERSLAVDERLLTVNPESSQAARDVSVSLTKLADFLASRGLAEDAKQALAHYTRSLAVREQLLTANPESAQAARDVSVGLNKLADFLTSRGQAEDARQALAHYTRSLAVRERLLTANPESAQAARDVMLTLERLSAWHGQQGPSSAREALDLQMRALAIAKTLASANPNAYFHGRAAAVSSMAAFQYARAAGEEQLAGECRGNAHAILHRFASAGYELDPPMRRLYDQLNSSGSTP